MDTDEHRFIYDWRLAFYASLVNPNTLNEAIARLASAYHKNMLPRLLQPPPDPQAVLETKRRCIAREPVLRKAIDQACRQWAETQSWSLTDGEARELLLARVAEARHFAKWLGARRSRLEGTLSEVLTWLLVDYWRLAGFYRWVAGASELPHDAVRGE